jgi:hypothetical protein
MRRSIVVLFSILLAAGAVCLQAQVVPTAFARPFSLTVGGTASIYQPDFAGEWETQSPWLPIAQSSTQPLFGAGAYVDMRLTRWVQLEAEGHWQHFNQFAGISQDNYLAGPRLPIYHFREATVYGKALGGLSEMTFGNGVHGHYPYGTLAFGGGMDGKLTKRISLRAFDVEYQYWPSWNNSTLSPYGVSAGVGYRIF